MLHKICQLLWFLLDPVRQTGASLKMQIRLFSDGPHGPFLNCYRSLESIFYLQNKIRANS